MTRLNAIITSMMMLACIFLYGQPASEEVYWSQFRGPNSTGLGPSGSQPPLEFGINNNLQWNTSIPPGTSSPVIWENSIYLTGYQEDKNALLTFCINRVTGEMIWCDTIFPEKTELYHAVSSPAQSTPAVDKDGIYVYFASCGMRCYNHDGSVKWDLPMICPEKKKWGHPVSPVVIDDIVILNLDYRGEKFRSLLALNKRTGETVWKTLTFDNPSLKHFGYPGYSTPVRYKDQVILHKSGGVAAYSLDDGQPVWWLPVVTNGISTPLIHNQQIVIASWNELTTDHQGDYFNYGSFEEFLSDYDKDSNHVISRDEIPENMMLFDRPELTDIENPKFTLLRFYTMLDSDKNDSINADEWKGFADFVGKFVEDVGLFTVTAGKHGELTRDDILWNVEEKAPEVPSPVAFEDCIYMLKNGGWLTCMDARTGNINYQERIGGSGAVLASPIVANSHLYLASYNGTINVIKTGKLPIPVHETRLPGNIAATPAIAGNSLYVRTSDGLFAFTNQIP